MMALCGRHGSPERASHRPAISASAQVRVLPGEAAAWIWAMRAGVMAPASPARVAGGGASAARMVSRRRRGSHRVAPRAVAAMPALDCRRGTATAPHPSPAPRRAASTSAYRIHGLGRAAPRCRRRPAPPAPGCCLRPSAKPATKRFGPARIDGGEKWPGCPEGPALGVVTPTPGAPTPAPTYLARRQPRMRTGEVAGPVAPRRLRRDRPVSRRPPPLHLGSSGISRSAWPFGHRLMRLCKNPVARQQSGPRQCAACVEPEVQGLRR